MKTEQVPSEKPRSPQPEAAHIARVAHNLILSVLVAEQVSFSSSPPITRVAIIRGLHITASTGIESAPSHNIPHPASTPSPHFAAACAILCDDPPFGLPSPRHCAVGRSKRGLRGSMRRSPLWTNFPPPLLRRPASSKRGPRESSDELKAKYLLAPVMMEAAAAQRFTFSTTSSSSRSLSLLCSDGARSCNFWHDLIGCGCNYECRTVRCVSCVFRVLGLA